MESPQCKECGKQRRSLIRAKLPCTDCQLEKFLKKAEGLDFPLLFRQRFLDKKLIIRGEDAPEDALYKCKTCRLVTDDVRLLFDHITYSGHEYEQSKNGKREEYAEIFS